MLQVLFTSTYNIQSLPQPFLTSTSIVEPIMFWDIYVVAIVSFASLHTVAYPSAKQVRNLAHKFLSPSTISARDGVLAPGPLYQPGMWVWPSSITSYPSCMANTPTADANTPTTDSPICQPIQRAMDTCSSYMCVAQYSMLGFVGCTQSATLINETCLCEYQLDSCYQESCGLMITTCKSIRVTVTDTIGV